MKIYPKIRKATEKDFYVVQNLVQKLNKDQYNKYDKSVNPDFALSKSGKKYIKKIINTHGVVFLAEEKNIVIAFVLAAIEPIGEFRLINNYCEIDFMWVDEEFRNQGVGSLLIKSVENWCVKKGIKRMRIIVDFLNKKALKLYKNQGFKEYDIILERDL